MVSGVRPLDEPPSPVVHASKVGENQHRRGGLSAACMFQRFEPVELGVQENVIQDRIRYPFRFTTTAIK